MALPQKLDWPKAQTQWAQQLDPLIKNVLTQGNFLQNVSITSGTNVINHQLGRTQLGWYIVDQNAAATFYRSQPFNNLTLTLNSSANCVISLWVF